MPTVFFTRSISPESPFPVQQTPSAFIRTHNEASGVLALCGGNPKLSAIVIRA
jgi:hypothetical protein